jgi:tetratricopeptide repeat protein
VSWVREHYGIDTVKRWYGGEDLPALTGSAWGDLQKSWWSDLDRYELGDAELATARARFDRPGVLERRCPHEVDERMHDAESRQATGDLDGAIDSYRAALSLDPDNVQAHFGVASCYDRLAQPSEARAQLENVASSGVQPETIKSGALERIADLALRAGNAPEAQRLYIDAAKGVTSEDRLRTIDIKRHYAGEPQAREALVALLIGTSASGPDEIEALDRIGQWRAEAKSDGTPDYLLGRQHFTRNDFALAADRLDAALEKGLPLQRAKNEALRLRLLCACALGQTDKAQSLLKDYRSQPLVSHARARIAEGLVWRASRQLKP